MNALQSEQQQHSYKIHLPTAEKQLNYDTENLEV